MQRPTCIRSLPFVALTTACAQAWAHEGHGAAVFHWHDSDVLGLVLAGALAVVALWLARK